MAKQKLSNYDYYIKTNTSKYAGEWIAIGSQKILAHGSDAQQVYLQATQQAKSKHISLAKVPQEQMLILKLRACNQITFTFLFTYLANFYVG